MPYSALLLIILNTIFPRLTIHMPWFMIHYYLEILSTEIITKYIWDSIWDFFIFYWNIMLNAKHWVTSRSKPPLYTGIGMHNHLSSPLFSTSSLSRSCGVLPPLYLFPILFYWFTIPFSLAISCKPCLCFGLNCSLLLIMVHVYFFQQLWVSFNLCYFFFDVFWECLSCHTHHWQEPGPKVKPFSIYFCYCFWISPFP